MRVISYVGGVWRLRGTTAGRVRRHHVEQVDNGTNHAPQGGFDLWPVQNIPICALAHAVKHGADQIHRRCRLLLAAVAP